jgi:2-furoyl-CoA dehydrogenase large subunit
LHSSEQSSERTLKDLLRIEDGYLLRGQGNFLDDLPTPSGTLFAAIVRSSIAHGKILAVREQAALEIPGVRAVLLPSEVQAWSDPFVVSIKSPVKQWSLAVDVVRYVGEPIAVVIAESRAAAEDGVDAVEVDYEPFDVLIDPREALSDAAIKLHPELGSNCIVDRRHEYGEVDKAFGAAAFTIVQESLYPRNSCTPMECGGVIAQYHEHNGAYSVTSNFMGPFSLHVVMAAALRVPGNKLRHRYPQDSGGSFGVKQAMLPYVVLIALASRKVRLPVKFIEDRLEHLVAATSATSRITTLKAAVDSAGKILALDYDQIEDCGAYLRAPEPATLYRMHGCLTGAYDIPNLRVRNRVVLINKTPTGLVRGFGGPQVYFSLERLIQKIANKLNKSVPEIYRQNYIEREQFPYAAAAGGLYDSGDYRSALSTLESAADYEELIKRQSERRAQGKLYGIGYASIVEPSISNMGYITTVLTPEQRAKAGPKNGAIATATVAVDASGSVNVVVASTPAGQGHQTVIANVIGDLFGLPANQIIVNTELDTAKDAWSAGSGNYSSRFAGAVVGAVFLAAEKIKNKIATYAATVYGCSTDEIVFRDGKILNTANSGQTSSFSRMAGAFHWSPALVSKNLGSALEPGLRETAHYSPEVLTPPDEHDRINTSAAYGFVLDVCGIEIDIETCQARIDRYITLHDAGRILERKLVNGQILGAFAQGVGAALYEEFSYDQSGNFLSGTFADYRVPTAQEIPEPRIIHQETLSPFTPLGAKGVGEGNNMSTPVCIANAIADALDYSDIQLPATPPKIYQWLTARGHLEKISPAPKSLTTIPDASRNLIRASGEILFDALPDSIFDILLDTRRLMSVIPGCEKLSRNDLDGVIQYECEVILRIGVIKARFDASIELSEIDKPSGLRLSGKGRSSLGLAQGSGLVTLSRQQSQTILAYNYEANVTGKLAAIGSRLLEASARVVLNQLFRALAREAEGRKRKPGVFHSLSRAIKRLWR